MRTSLLSTDLGLTLARSKGVVAFAFTFAGVAFTYSGGKFTYGSPA